MSNPMEPEKKARHELIREVAKEQGEVIIAHLAVDLAQEELWGTMRGLNPNQKKIFIAWCKEDTASALSTPKMLNELREWYALSRGVASIWKRWVTMTRRESSHVYQLLARDAHDRGHHKRKDYENAHEERFNEKLESISVSRKGDWSPDDEQPIIKRHKP